MRVFVWFPAVLLVSWLGCTSSDKLDPNEQAQVSTALDTAQFAIQAIDDENKAAAKALKDALKVSNEMESVELLKKQTKLVKYASMVGKALKAVQAASAIASFVFTFFMPSQLDVITDLIKERFKEVNAKLDRLDEKLDEMETSIKANSAFNTFLSAWIKWEYALRNGAKKLSDIHKAMETKTRRIEQVKLAEEYVNYYEDNQLFGNLENLYRMAALPKGITQRNIFDIFTAEHGCDVTKLSELMILIKNIMTSAAQQKMSYYYFKGDEKRATEAFKDVQTYFFRIRRAFDDRVFLCKRNSVDNAKKDANKILKKMKGFSQESIVQSIFNELRVMYPWYTWAVAAINGNGPTMHSLEWRGSTYFKLEDRSDPDKVKEYYVVYDDTESFASCLFVKDANTLLVFKGCDGCKSDYIYASNNIVSKKRCGKSTLEGLVDFPYEVAHSSYEVRKHNIPHRWVSCSKCSNRSHPDCVYDKCVDRVKQEVQTWDFIASAGNSNYDICRLSEKCNGHGQCKQIPFTKTHQCICEEDYEGQSCEKRVDFDDTIQQMMSELRKTFNFINGVPTAVDVFFSIRSLSEKLDAVLEKIKASFAHTKNIIKHSKVIYNVEDIADLYAKLQKNQLTFDQFGQRIDAYLRTVTTFELQNRLRKMILGKGTLDKPGNDIYNSYKREYFSYNRGGCSTKYNKDIKGFKDNLAYLDHALGEALLLHQKWLLETKGTKENLRTKYKKEAEHIRNIFKNRQAEYNKYWKSYSCGTLSVDGTDILCKDELTFEGMTLTLKCDKRRQSTPSQVTCKKIGNVLKWDSQPKCKFVWGSFGGWGHCSKTCGGGVKYNYRSCLGSNNVNDCIRDQGGSNYKTESCETQECCPDQYGKFKCSNGRCIQKSLLCDGNDDCGNNDDESFSQCPNYITSGESIALRSNAKSSQWLSCWCTINCGLDRCKLRGCPGKEMEFNDWLSCKGEIFALYLTDYPVGEPVRSGDRVALSYGGGYWLSCGSKGDVCPTRECPGMDWDNCFGEIFWIYSLERQGSCSGDATVDCEGKPIQKGDTLFLLKDTDGPGWWLSEDDGDIKTRSCPGLYLNNDDKRCSSELWTIIK